MAKRKKTEDAGQEQPKADQTQQQQQSGRKANGQFALGNEFGPGNPFARQVARLRQAALNVVGDKDIEEIFSAIMALAKNGNLQAAKLILSYTIGKPAQAENPDQMDQQELELVPQGTRAASEALRRAESMTPRVSVELVRMNTGAAVRKQSRVLSKWLAQGYVDPADVAPKEHPVGTPSGLGDDAEWARLEAEIRRSAAEARAAQRKDNKSP